jgi:hypothetical protein
MLVIVSVSIFDSYWTFKTADSILMREKNPIGVFLIKADNGDVALFMTLKMIGTMLVILIIPLLFLFKKWWGLTTASVLAAFQTALFFYLTYGTF